MKVPENVSFILQSLERAGFDAYIVGGSVRDVLMHLEPKDWDIATSAEPEQVKSIFQKTYDTGLKHGTVTVVLNELRYEITTLRLDGEYRDNRHPETVTFSKNINDDLERRDFTINAIAYNAQKGYIDPFGGIKDIKNKVVMGVGSPSKRFEEDALRMLRALRFSATLGFRVEERTAEAIIKNAILIKNISNERVRDELLKIMAAPNVGIVFSKEFSELMSVYFQPLAQSIAKNKSDLEKLLSACKKNQILRFAVLISFLDEEEATELLTKMKLSNSTFNRLLDTHKIQSIEIPNSYCSVAKAISIWGFDVFEDYLYLQMLNTIAFNKSLDYVLQIEEHHKFIRENNFPVFIKDLALNGFDLNREFNIEGPGIGKTLEGLLDFVHMNPYKNTYEKLLNEAYRLITRND